MNINSTISKFWKSIEIIFEQEQLVHKEKATIVEIKEELDHKHGEATRIIRFLN